VRTALAACERLGLLKEQERLRGGLEEAARDDRDGSGEKCAGRPGVRRSPGAQRSADQFRKAVQQRMNVQEFMYHVRLAAEHDDATYASEVLQGMLAHHGPHVCAESRPGGSALQCGLKAVVKQGDAKDVVELAQAFSQISTTVWSIVLGELRTSASSEMASACVAEMKRLGVKLNAAMYAHLVAIELQDSGFSSAAALLQELREAQLWSSELVLILGRALQGLFQEKISESLNKISAKERLVGECIALSKVLDNLLTEDFSRALINSSMSLGMLASLEKVLETFPRQGVPMYTAVMKAYSSLGKVDETLMVWDEMTIEKQITPSQVCLGQALNVLASNNRPTQARALLLEWRSQVEPNCVMYTTVIKGLARAKDFDAALEVWEQMKADGIEPNTKAFNTLLDACARAGRMDTDGSKIFAEMARLQIPVASVTVSTAVKGFCAKGLLNEAAASLGGDAKQQILAKQHSADDASAFNALLDGCVKAGDLGRFDQTYGEMVAGGVRPTSFTLTALVKRYGNAGQLDQAYRCVETLCEKYGKKLLNIHVATCLISASFRNRAANRAIQFFDTLKSSGVMPDAITYATVISGTKTMGAEGNSVALRFVREALVPPGPGLSDAAIVEFVGRLESAGTLATVGRTLVKDLTVAQAPIPRALSTAISRAVTSSSTSEQILGRRPASWKAK
jgi:pentatricopeptide repeat protein